MKVKELFEQEPSIVEKNIEYLKHLCQIEYRQYDPKDYVANKNGTVTFKRGTSPIIDDKFLSKYDYELPFNISNADYITIIDSKSCKGFPVKCTALIVKSEKITSLEALNTIAKEYVDLNIPNVKKFSGFIDTEVLSINSIGVNNFTNANKYINAETIVFDNIDPLGRRVPIKIASNVLSFLKIPKLQHIHIKQFAKDEGNEIDQVFSILNKHLQNDKDILECQEELITNGFKEYAKL
jgi:hypothetical protein